MAQLIRNRTFETETLEPAARSHAYTFAEVDVPQASAATPHMNDRRRGNETRHPPLHHELVPVLRKRCPVGTFAGAV